MTNHISADHRSQSGATDYIGYAPKEGPRVAQKKSSTDRYKTTFPIGYHMHIFHKKLNSIMHAAPHHGQMNHSD